MEITEATIVDIPELCVLLYSLYSQEAEFKPNHEVQARGLTTIINGSEVGGIMVARRYGCISKSSGVGCRLKANKSIH